ncbi:MAG: zinc ribbon domain-containing protein [Ignavibacteriales bacterium]|nr:zinc ribbon domain-containing protein [Ignavibacteriales bacterium]
MPTYDYKCSNCNYIFEYFQPMSAEPLTECPKCKGSLKRIIGTGAGPIFKGTGFYHTDYKGNQTQSKKSNKSEAKPETKPAESDKKSSKDDKK